MMCRQLLHNIAPESAKYGNAYMPNDVPIEDHAYALTMISVWEDREEDNRLLLECGHQSR